MTANAGRVVVAGDWHGDSNWATHVIARVARSECSLILHVGDFGIWPGRDGASFMRNVERMCTERGVTILVTPGNHEDWDQIDAHTLTDRGDGLGSVAWFTDHVAVLPRGHRFVLPGANGAERSFVSLGGAPSIDLHYRTPGRSWWPQEAITDADVEHTVAGGPAHYMLTHDCPSPGGQAVQRIVDGPSTWRPDALTYCAQGRQRLTRAWWGVRPKVLFHGHYHVRDTTTVLGGPPGDPFECRIESLDMDGQDGNTVILDVATGEITPV